MSDYEFLMKTYKKVELCFPPNETWPHHHCDPDESIFHIASQGDFQSLSASQVQKIFRKQHILVTDMPIEKMGFDRKGLERLRAPNDPGPLYPGL
jgi:hypothetical protein